MKALVVVESVFGNTRQVAEAVADGLAGWMEVRTVDVADAPMTMGIDMDLLVVGGPTHAFRLARLSTRRSAAEGSAGSVAAAESGLREWLDALQWGSGLATVTFDTRIDRPRVPGSAAKWRLKWRGYALIARPETFWVGLPEDSEKSLVPALPVDLAAVQADDALLDALGGPNPSPEGSDARLAQLLMAWRHEVDSELITRLVDTDTALAVVARARRGTSRPLVDGELKRAYAWGEALGRRFTVARHD